MLPWTEGGGAPSYPEVSLTSPRAGGSREGSPYCSSSLLQSSSSPAIHLSSFAKHPHHRLQPPAGTSVTNSSTGVVKEVGYARSQRPFLRRSSLSSVFGGTSNVYPSNTSVGGAGASLTMGQLFYGGSGNTLVDLEEALGVAVTAAVRGAVALVEAEEMRRHDNAARSFALSLKKTASKDEEERKAHAVDGSLPSPDAEGSSVHSTFVPPLSVSLASSPAIEGCGMGRGTRRSFSLVEGLRKTEGGQSTMDGTTATLEGLSTTTKNATGRRFSSRPVSTGSEFFKEGRGGVGPQRQSERRHSSVSSTPGDRIQFLLSSSSSSFPSLHPSPTTSPPLPPKLSSLSTTAFGSDMGGGAAAGGTALGGITAISTLPLSSEASLVRRAREFIVGYLEAYCDRVLERQTASSAARAQGGGEVGSAEGAVGATSLSLPSVGALPSSSSVGVVAEEMGPSAYSPVHRHLPAGSTHHHAHHHPHPHHHPHHQHPIVTIPTPKHLSQSALPTHSLSPLNSPPQAMSGARGVSGSHPYPTTSPPASTVPHFLRRHNSHPSLREGTIDGVSLSSTSYSLSGNAKGTTPTTTAPLPLDPSQCRVSDGAVLPHISPMEVPHRHATGSRPISSHVIRRKTSFSHPLLPPSPVTSTGSSPVITSTMEGSGVLSFSPRTHGRLPLPTSTTAVPPTPIPPSPLRFSSRPFSTTVAEHQEGKESVRGERKPPADEEEEEEEEEEGSPGHRRNGRHPTLSAPSAGMVGWLPSSGANSPEEASKTMETDVHLSNSHVGDPSMDLMAVLPLSSSPSESPAAESPSHMPPPSFLSISSSAPSSSAHPLTQMTSSPKKEVFFSVLDATPMAPLGSPPYFAPSASFFSPSHQTDGADDDQLSPSSSLDGLPQGHRPGSPSYSPPTFAVPKNLPFPLPCSSFRRSPSREYSASPTSNAMSTPKTDSTSPAHSPGFPSSRFQLPPPLASSLYAPGLTMRVLKASERPPFPVPTVNSPTSSSRATFSNSLGASFHSADGHSPTLSSSTSSSSYARTGTSTTTVTSSLSSTDHGTAGGRAISPAEEDAAGLPFLSPRTKRVHTVKKRWTLTAERRKKKGRAEREGRHGSKRHREESDVQEKGLSPRLPVTRESTPEWDRRLSASSPMSHYHRSSGSFTSFRSSDSLLSPRKTRLCKKIATHTKRKRKSSKQPLVSSLSKTVNQSQLTHALLQPPKSVSHSSRHLHAPQPTRPRRHKRRLATSPLSVGKSSVHPGVGDASTRPSSSSSFFPLLHSHTHSHSYLWLVDFNEVSAVRGLSDTFVSISLLHNSHPVLTVMFFPFVGEKFTWNPYGFLASCSAIFSKMASPQQQVVHPGKGLQSSTTTLGGGENSDVHGSVNQGIGNKVGANGGGGGGNFFQVLSDAPRAYSPSPREGKASTLSSPSAYANHRRSSVTGMGGGGMQGSRSMFRGASSVGGSTIFAYSNLGMERGGGVTAPAGATIPDDERSAPKEDTEDEDANPPRRDLQSPFPSCGGSASFSGMPSNIHTGRHVNSPTRRESLNSPVLPPTSTIVVPPQRSSSIKSLLLHHPHASTSSINSSSSSSTSTTTHVVTKQNSLPYSHQSNTEHSPPAQGFLRSFSSALHGRDWAGAGTAHPPNFFSSSTSPTRNSSPMWQGGNSNYGTLPPFSPTLTGTPAQGGSRPESAGGTAGGSPLLSSHPFTPWWSGGELFVSIEDNGSFLNGTRLRTYASATAEGTGGEGRNHPMSASRSASLHPPFTWTPPLQPPGSPTVFLPSSSPVNAQPPPPPPPPTLPPPASQDDCHSAGIAGLPSSFPHENPSLSSCQPSTTTTSPFPYRSPCPPPTPPPSSKHPNTLSITTLSTELSSSSSLISTRRANLHASMMGDNGSLMLQLNTHLSQSYGAGFSSNSSDAVDAYLMTCLTVPTAAHILFPSIPPISLLSPPSPLLPLQFFSRSSLRRSLSISSATSATTTTPLPSVLDRTPRNGIAGTSPTEKTPLESRGEEMTSPSFPSVVPQEEVASRLTSIASHLLRRPDVERIHFGNHPVVSVVHIAAGRGDATLLTDIERVGWYHLLGPALLVQEAGGMVKALSKPLQPSHALPFTPSSTSTTKVHNVRTKKHIEEEEVPLPPRTKHLHDELPKDMDDAPHVHLYYSSLDGNENVALQPQQWEKTGFYEKAEKESRGYRDTNGRIENRHFLTTLSARLNSGKPPDAVETAASRVPAIVMERQHPHEKHDMLWPTTTFSAADHPPPPPPPKHLAPLQETTFPPVHTYAPSTPPLATEKPTVRRRPTPPPLPTAGPPAPFAFHTDSPPSSLVPLEAPQEGKEGLHTPEDMCATQKTTTSVREHTRKIVSGRAKGTHRRSKTEDGEHHESLGHAAEDVAPVQRRVSIIESSPTPGRRRTHGWDEGENGRTTGSYPRLLDTEKGAVPTATIHRLFSSTSESKTRKASISIPETPEVESGTVEKTVKERKNSHVESPLKDRKEATHRVGPPSSSSSSRSTSSSETTDPSSTSITREGAIRMRPDTQRARSASTGVPHSSSPLPLPLPSSSPPLPRNAFVEDGDTSMHGLLHGTPPPPPSSGAPRAGMRLGRSGAKEVAHEEKEGFSLLSPPSPPPLNSCPPHERSPRSYYREKKREKHYFSSHSYRLSDAGENETSPSENSAKSSTGGVAPGSSTNGSPQALFYLHSSTSHFASLSSLMLSHSSYGGASGVHGNPEGKSWASAGNAQKKKKKGGMGSGGGSRKTRKSSFRTSERGEEIQKQTKELGGKEMSSRRSVTLPPQRPEDISGIIATFNVQLAEAISQSVDETYFRKE